MDAFVTLSVLVVLIVLGCITFFAGVWQGRISYKLLVRDLESDLDAWIGNYRTEVQKNNELHAEIAKLSSENINLKCDLDSAISNLKKITSEHEAYKTIQNSKIDELYSNVKNLIERKESEHEHLLECNTCYWREQMTRDRNDFMETIASKEAMIQHLQKALSDKNEPKKIAVSGFSADTMTTFAK